MALRTALLYAVVATLWILFSDALLVRMVSKPETIGELAALKGSLFVLVTAVLLWMVFRRQLRLVEQEATGRKKAEEERSDSEKKFSFYAERAPLAMFVVDQSGKCVDFNPAAIELLGYAAKTLPGLVFSEVVPDNHRAHAIREFEVLKQRGHIETDCRLKRRDGTLVWVSVRGVKISDDRFLAYCQDITQRMDHEREIERLSRIRATLGAVNQMIVRSTSREELFQDLCRIVAEHAGFKLAWVALIDPETRNLKVAAHAGDCNGALEQIKLYADDRQCGHCPPSICVREGKPSIFNDFLNDPRSWPWQELAMEHGIRAMAAMPITHCGEVHGAFTVCSGELNPFQDKEIALLQELAMDISYALEHLEQQAQKQKAELALRNHETLLRETGRIAKVGGWDFDAVTGRIYCTEEIFHIHEVDFTPEPTMETIQSLFPKETYGLIEEMHRKALEQATPFDLELEFTTAKGNHKWVRMIGHPLVENGKVVRLQGSVQDITEHKLAEDSLHLQSAALEAAGNAIMITDSGGKIEWANSAFTDTTGYTLSEAIGRTPRIFKSGRNSQEMYWEMWNTILAGHVWHGELINRRKDGSLYPDETTITPVRNKRGKITHFIAIKQDVTARKKLEEQFRQSQKMEAIGTLAGGVAHDFNNLLAVILMQTEIMAEEDHLSIKQSDGLRDIISAAERAADLTRQLLMFSRKNVMQPAKIDLNRIVSNLTRMLVRIVGEDIKMQLKHPPSPLAIHADPGMMEQILMNLSVNARDAMPRGGRLMIETLPVDLDEFGASQMPQARAGSFVCLSVSDTGGGIPPEILPHIFEPFFTTKDVGRGTGLGLATVFGIVQQHQGWIDVRSVVGEGTTFRIYFPRLAGEEIVKTTPSNATTMRGGHETILLVEDEAPLRYIARQVLTHLGYEVLEAGTGREALEIWRQFRDQIKLVVADLVMPDGMNGKDMADRMKDELPDLNIIYISGYSREMVGRDFPLVERENFLAKPFQAHQLAQIVRARLDAIEQEPEVRFLQPNLIAMAQ